jgi:hypothetical protein
VEYASIEQVQTMPLSGRPIMQAYGPISKLPTPILADALKTARPLNPNVEAVQKGRMTRPR